MYYFEQVFDRKKTAYFFFELIRSISLFFIFWFLRNYSQFFKPINVHILYLLDKNERESIFTFLLFFHRVLHYL